jgi:hypothetical protein
MEYNSDMQSINHSTITTNGVVRPTLVEVNLDHLTENLLAIRRAVAPSKVMAILKANAYGHGLVDVAHHMVSQGIETIGVAVLEEGILLREQGISAPILVLGGILGNQVPLFLKYDLALTASSLEKLRQIDEPYGGCLAGDHDLPDKQLFDRIQRAVPGIWNCLVCHLNVCIWQEYLPVSLPGENLFDYRIFELLFLGWNRSFFWPGIQHLHLVGHYLG